MIEWIKNLAQNFTNFVEWVNNLIDQIVAKFIEFYNYIKSAFEFVSQALQMLPSFYLITGGIIITVLVIYLILGREPGGD